ncbi:MAG: oxidoreductase family protein [Salibacteraceae bacterium]
MNQYITQDFKKYLLKATESSDCEELEIIQSLWSGYGKISRYHLFDSPFDTVVVKNISLSQSNEHPRGWNTNNSHNRKVKSYQVETHWYEKWNQRCNDNCRVPKFLGSFSNDNNQWIVLEDLNANFPLRKHQIDFNEVKVCLKWLANFHATFLNEEPTDLWAIGTYWHLGTRPDEYEKIEHKELKSKAKLIDEALNYCKFKTIVHGDAKLANFCFSENGGEVAAVDFQYVGGGCGMKDVGYFLGSCLSSSECELYEKELLDFYFLELQSALENGQNLTSSKNIDFYELEQEWRKMYPFACVDFTRFLLGWMPTHQKVNNYNLKLMNSLLSRL